MSFLSKSKDLANKNTGAGAVPTVPPRPTGLPKPPGGAKPAGIPKPPVGAPKPPSPVGSKPAGIPKPAPKVEEPKAEENKSIAPAVEKEDKGLLSNNPFKLMRDKKESEKPAKEVAAPKKEVEVKEEPKTETKVETKAPAVPEAEQPQPEAATPEVKEEKQPVKKAASKKTTKKTTAKVEVTSETETTSAPQEFVSANTRTALSFDEAMKCTKSGFVDQEWEEFRKDTEKKLSDIIITNSMTSTALKSVLADLNELRTALWPKFMDTKSQYEALCSKEPAGLIERVKNLNSKGSNAEERKINGILAVSNYKDVNGNTINLFELLDELRERFYFFKGLMETIEYRTKLLVTMLGGMKLEK